MSILSFISYDIMQRFVKALKIVVVAVDGYTGVIRGIVFPACAGVILSETIRQIQSLSVPRMCGGDPSLRKHIGV